MSNPQQREISRDERTQVKSQGVPQATDPKKSRGKTHAHGQDKGNKGGGKGGGVPPDQQPDHPD